MFPFYLLKQTYLKAGQHSSNLCCSRVNCTFKLLFTLLALASRPKFSALCIVLVTTPSLLNFVSICHLHQCGLLHMNLNTSGLVASLDLAGTTPSS